MLSIFPSLHSLQLYKDSATEPLTRQGQVENPLIFLYCAYTTDRLFVMGLDRVLGVHKWKNSSPTYLPPYTLDLDRKRRVRRRVGVHFAVGLTILPGFFAVTRCERYVLSCGHWDNSLRVTAVGSGQLHQSLTAHKDIVTCVGISEQGDYVVTGSKDATVMVWQNHEFIDKAGDRRADESHGKQHTLLCDRPKHVLYGHDDEVTCVLVSTDYDTVASGSRDGTIILHTLRTGRYTRTITPNPPPTVGPTSAYHVPAIRFLSLSRQGTLVAYSYSVHSSTLYTFTINGRPMHAMQLTHRLYTLLLSANGQYLVVGGDGPAVSVHRMADLQCVQQLPVAVVGGESVEGGVAGVTVRCLCLTPNEQHLLAGTSTGELLIYALDQHTLTNKLLKRLQQIGL